MHGQVSRTAAAGHATSKWHNIDVCFELNSSFVGCIEMGDKQQQVSEHCRGVTLRRYEPCNSVEHTAVQLFATDQQTPQKGNAMMRIRGIQVKFRLCLLSAVAPVQYRR